MSKIFFDSNILLYSVDRSDRAKRDRCRDLLKSAEEERTGVISTQVMQEFYSIATRKFGMEPMLAKETLESFEIFEIVVVSPTLIYSAADCQLISKLSFWDALIVVAAEAALCGTISTEDLNSGQMIRGMRITSPFKP